MYRRDDDFAEWVLQRAMRRLPVNADGNVVLVGNFQLATYNRPPQEVGETKIGYDARCQKWRNSLPRGDHFEPYIALAYEAIVKEPSKEKSESRLEKAVCVYPTVAHELKQAREEIALARGVRGLEWIEMHPILGGSNRGSQTNHEDVEQTVASRESDNAQKRFARMRTAAARYRRKCHYFGGLFEIFQGLYIQEKSPPKTPNELIDPLRTRLAELDQQGLPDNFFIISVVWKLGETCLQLGLIDEAEALFQRCAAFWSGPDCESPTLRTEAQTKIADAIARIKTARLIRLRSRRIAARLRTKRATLRHHRLHPQNDV